MTRAPPSPPNNKTGGGGCAITLLTEPHALTNDAKAREAALVEAVEGVGFEAFSTRVGGPGVLLHDTPAAGGDGNDESTSGAAAAAAAIFKVASHYIDGSTPAAGAASLPQVGTFMATPKPSSSS